MLRLILCLCLSFPISTVGQSVLSTEKLTALEQVLQKQIDRDFTGVVLLAKKDSIVLARGIGYTDRTQQFPISTQTLFNIASISKTITAVGIMKLREQGLLQLEDRIGRFLDHVPKRKKSITIAHLLSHRSGLKQNYVTDGQSDRTKAIRLMMKDRLAFQPGSDFQYSNQNYILLAAIIEILTQQPYETFIREQILIPAGMKQTFFWGAVDDLNPALTAQKIEALSEKTRARNWGYIGSGGIYTNVLDLYAFFQSFQSDRLLTTQSKALMLEVYHQFKNGTTAGYAWFAYPNKRAQFEYWTRGNESFGHNAVLRWFPEENLLLIVFANTGERGSPSETDNRIVSEAILDVVLE